MRGSVSYGSGKKYRLPRKELEAVLTSRYYAIRSDEGFAYDEGLLREALCIADALRGLCQREEYSGIVETLEMSGVLSAKEARHFLGISSRRQLTLEKAAQAASPRLTERGMRRNCVRLADARPNVNP